MLPGSARKPRGTVIRAISERRVCALLLDVEPYGGEIQRVGPFSLLTAQRLARCAVCSMISAV